MDLHVDTLWQMTKHGQFDLNKGAPYSAVSAEGLKKAGLRGAVFALYVPWHLEDNSVYLLNEQIEFAKAQNVEGFKIYLALEGGALIQNDLRLLEMYAEVGIKYLTLTHNHNIWWASSATDSPDSGLSNFGREVVKLCEQLGVVVDVSHASYETCMDVLEVSSKPVIASHSGCYSVRAHPRNLKDEVIRGIAQSGGVVGIPFVRKFVGSVGEIGRHIDHVVQLVGIDHVAIGSDIDGAQMVERFKDIGDWKDIASEALEGYGEDALKKILSTNAERLML